MTTSATAPDTVRLHSPGELIAALPALLGFHPTHSLVVACFDSPGRLGPVARLDLPDPGDLAAATAVVARVAAICAGRATAEAVLVVVDEAAAGPSRRRALDRAAPRRPLVRRVRQALADVGTEVIAAHHVGRVEAGAPWGSYRNGDHGSVPDPGASPMAVAHVLSGRVIHRSRTELAMLLAPDATSGSADIAAALDRAGRGRVDRPATACLSAVAALITRADAVSGPDERAVAAVALGELGVRDACFAFAASTDADRAEQLWTLLVRCMPARQRVEPAVLLAHAAYCRGDGALAGLALDVALGIEPGHRMAVLLSAALDAGLDPSALYGMATSALADAAELGVRLTRRPDRV